jgi:hypothetical protein
LAFGVDGRQTVDVLLFKSIDGTHVAFDVGRSAVHALMFQQKKRACRVVDEVAVQEPQAHFSRFPFSLFETI